ncbi:MAG: hypothetical protein INQ03_17210 [Candidatus Heimdallarchaeota archaeon]|nr:hypothetical protein [Candidatus Heimdallarchaeota archaeon]
MILQPSNAESEYDKYIDVDLGDYHVYNIINYIVDGVWNQPYQEQDNLVSVYDGEKLKIHFVGFDGTQIKLNVSDSNQFGFMYQDMLDFGSYAIITDWNYWMDMSNIKIKDKLYEQYGTEDVELKENVSLSKYGFSYKLRFKLTDVIDYDLKLTYNINTGYLVTKYYTIRSARDDAFYESDKLWLHHKTFGNEWFEEEEEEFVIPWRTIAMIATPFVLYYLYRINLKPELKAK